MVSASALAVDKLEKIREAENKAVFFYNEAEELRMRAESVCTPHAAVTDTGGGRRERVDGANRLTKI